MAKKKLDKDMIKDVAGGVTLYVGLIDNVHWMIYDSNGEPVGDNIFDNELDAEDYAFNMNNVNDVVILEDGDLDILRQAGVKYLGDRDGVTCFRLD